MNIDLLALAIAVALAAAVVILGLRRNLSETTRDGIPRFESDPEGATATLGLYEGEERRRRPLTPAQRRWLAAFYLLLALTQAAIAISSPDDRLIHAATAAAWAVAAAVMWLRKPRPSDRSGGRC